MLTNLLQRRPTVSISIVRYLLAIGILTTALIGEIGHTVEIASPYTVEVHLDPKDRDAEKNAYSTALTEALIRITGSNVVVNTDTASILFANPIRYVLQQKFGVNNTLVVTLDGLAIEQTLRDANVSVWSLDRPLTIIWLAVDRGLGNREIVSAEDSSYGFDGTIVQNNLLRERLRSVAARYGVPIIFPLLDIEDLGNIGFIDIWGGFDASLINASSRYKTSSVLVGRIRIDDPEPSRWTWHIGEDRIDWTGEPEQAIEELAKGLALRDAGRAQYGNQSFELVIGGVNSVDAYGQVQSYLENIDGIQSVKMKMVVSNQITYLVEFPRGSERLNKSLASSGFFVAENVNYPRNFPNSENSEEIQINALYYRYVH